MKQTAKGEAMRILEGEQGRSQEFELPWAMSKINELQKKNSEYEYAKVT